MTIAEVRHFIRQARIARWAWLRRLGMWRFVLLYGILGWGLPMFVMFGLLLPMVERPHRPPALDVILLSVVLTTLGGLLVGLVGWRKSEKEYNKSALQEPIRT
jgi:hypothetical protein